MSIRIALTDDHPLILAGVKKLLEQYAEMEITDCFNSGTSLLEGLQLRQPDVLLLDIQLSDVNGNELIRQIVRNYAGVRILILTNNNSTFFLKDMIRNGCRGYILKTVDGDTLRHAIQEVYQGREYIQPELKEQLLQETLKLRSQPTAQFVLTAREKEVLALIAREFTSAGIAAKLHLSTRTVENHRFSIMQKTGVKNTAGLTRLALELGLY